MNELLINDLPENIRTLALVCMNKQLEAFNDLIGKVFASIIHDIRSPISTVVSMMELLEASPLDSDNAEIIHEVKQQVDDTFRQIDRLFNWLNFKKNDTVGIDIAEIVRTIFAETCLQTENIQMFKMDRDNVVFAIEKEPAGLLNLLFRYAVKTLTCGGWISVQVLRSGQLTVISARDTGIRIEPEKARRIFEWIYKGSAIIESDDDEVLSGGLITQDTIEREGSMVWMNSSCRNAHYYFAIPVNLC